MKKIIVYFLLLFLVTPIIAAEPNTGVIKDLVDKFQTEVGLWGVSLTNVVVYPLFFTLTLISLAWKGGQLVLKGADLPDFAMEVVVFIMFTGFWFWIIGNAFDFADATIETFNKSANLATGTSTSMTPSSVMKEGLNISVKIVSKSGFFEKIGYAIAAFFVVILYFYIAAIVFLALLEAYIVAGAGIIVLGFAGSPWTSDIAKKYLLFVLAIGLKMYFTFIIVGIGIQFTSGFVNAEYGEQRNILALIGIIFLFAYLAGKIPEMAQSMLSGSSSGSSAIDAKGIVSSMGKAATAMTATAAGVAAATYQSHKAAMDKIGGGSGSSNPTIAAASQAAGAGGASQANMTPSNGKSDNNPNAIPNAVSSQSNSGGNAKPEPAVPTGDKSESSQSDSGDSDSKESQSNNESTAKNDDVQNPGDSSLSSGAAQNSGQSSVIQHASSQNSSEKNARIKTGLSYLRAFGGAYAKGTTQSAVDRLTGNKVKPTRFDTAKNISENRISDKIKGKS